MSMLKNKKQQEPLTAGSAGLVALAVEGEGWKSLLELVPTLRAQVALRCVDVETVSYDTVTTFPEANSALLDHMKAEYSDEHWYFVRDAQAWRRRAASAEKGDADVKADAATLSETYIADGAMQQVNIPDACRKEVLAKLAVGNVDAALLDSALKEVQKLIERDTLPRFRRAEALPAICQRLGPHSGSVQFVDEEKLTEAITKTAMDAAAFPKYSHSVTSDKNWLQFETDM